MIASASSSRPLAWRARTLPGAMLPPWLRLSRPRPARLLGSRGQTGRGLCEPCQRLGLGQPGFGCFRHVQHGLILVAYAVILGWTLRDGYNPQEVAWHMRIDLQRLLE